MASPVNHPSPLKNVAFPFGQDSVAGPSTTRALGVSGVAALSVEFVAKPQEAHRVQSTIPAALACALKEVTGFAGCLVMISDQESRLVTVVTLWAGEGRLKRCDENARRVRTLLAPYVDRCLRVQTFHAHLPFLLLLRPEASAAAGRPELASFSSEGEEVCVA